MRARRPRLRTRDARGELLVGDLGGDARAQPLPFAARVDRRGRRDDGGDEASRGAYDACVRRDGGRDGGAKLRRRSRVAACERDRQVPRVARTCPLNRKSLPFWEALRVFACSVRLGRFASQRLVRLLKDEKVDRDDDDDRL